MRSAARLACAPPAAMHPGGRSRENASAVTDRRCGRPGRPLCGSALVTLRSDLLQHLRERVHELRAIRSKELTDVGGADPGRRLPLERRGEQSRRHARKGTVAAFI